jgi:hypothetical protein
MLMLVPLSLGRAGANLVINGLIKDAEGEALRKQFEKELGVKVVQPVGWKHGAKVNRAAAPNCQGARRSRLSPHSCSLMHSQVALSTHDLSKPASVADMAGFARGNGDGYLDLRANQILLA